ncbi:MAG: endonuclease/exonuclease/phosphatase family protein [Bdellovibrionales bacterium]|nr:endonuclease/exonuclease/phosphatase family protein [Bdellovibrionales bacterium]
MGFRLVISLAVIAISQWAWATPARPYEDQDSFFKTNANSRQIKIMSYNALNLYDSQHDDGFVDYTYLPQGHPKKQNCSELGKTHYRELCEQLDWTNPKLQRKIEQLGKVILGHGQRPDLLALQEVENERVIKKLADHVGYKDYIVTNFKNRRGVDMALLYDTRNLEFVAKYIVESKGRDMLRVHFKSKRSGANLFVYVNHWAAQLGPTRLRVEAAKALREDISYLNDNYSNPSIVALGDFNTTFDEEAEVFDNHVLSQQGKFKMVEAHQESRRRYPQFNKHFPDGSYWRGRDNWQRFDRIFLSQNLLKTSNSIRADLESYRIVYSTMITGEYTFSEDPENESSQQITVRYPLRYNFMENPNYPLGYSDHLPVTLLLNL